MAEDAFKIISLVFEDAGPDDGADHGHDALILIDLPMDDRPARDVGEDLRQLVERPTATSEVVASAKLILVSQHDCGGLAEVGSESRMVVRPIAKLSKEADQLCNAMASMPTTISGVGLILVQ
jgi:hypothetical protein